MSQKSEQNRAKRVQAYMAQHDDGGLVRDAAAAAEEIGISRCQFGRAMSRLIATNDSSVANYGPAAKRLTAKSTKVSAAFKPPATVRSIASMV